MHSSLSVVASPANVKRFKREILGDEYTAENYAELRENIKRGKNPNMARNKKTRAEIINKGETLFIGSIY